MHTEALSKFTIEEVCREEGGPRLVILASHCDHWDYNFLKLSGSVGDMRLTMAGWHETSKTYGIQGYESGDYDTGVESGGPSDPGTYSAISYKGLGGLTEENFQASRYMQLGDAEEVS